MVKASFFNKVNKNENIDKIKEVSVNDRLDKNKDTVMIDRSITKYIIENFSDISLDIRDSLINLADTLENTIDYIEDKSSIVIKDSRNFKLSQDYRNKSMKIYEIVEKINDYVQWINEGYNTVNNKEVACESDEEIKEIKPEVKEVSESSEEKICITEDFTSKSPMAFKIDNYYSEVSDWKELTVKAADILTKKYKNNKNKVEVSVDDVVLKESIENDFRDSVIDILKIYSVPLKKFYVYVKQ